MTGCGNCNISFQSYEQMVAHMNIIHSSTFDEQEESHRRFVAQQTKIKNDPKLDSMREMAKLLRGN